MGTRSVIAIPQDGGFKGRYAHWDGYPSSMGVELLAIIERDGVDAARKVLTQEYTRWSTVDHTTTGDEDMTYRSGTPVPGYGCGYAEDDGDWITNDGDDWGTEWAYVIGDKGMTVLERRWNDGPHMTGMFGMGADADEGHWVERVHVTYDDFASARLILEELS